MEPEIIPLKKKKTRKKELVRKNSLLDDGRLCEMSRSWLSAFKTHLPQFEAFDSGLNNAFALNWQAQINTLDSYETDETFVDGQQTITEVVTKLTQSLLLQLDGAEYYVKRAFAGNNRILLEFGFEQLRKITVIGSARFTIGCFVFTKLLKDYEAALLAAGMPPTFIATFETTTGNLGEAEVQQEYTKRLRIRSTTNRITYFNTLYDTHQIVAKAAAIVFINRPDIAKQFER